MSEAEDSYINVKQSWRIDELFQDLAATRKNKQLEQLEEEFLCLLLDKKQPSEIADILGLARQTLNDKVSKKNGLYACVRKLTGGEVKSWKDLFPLLLEKYHVGSSAKKIVFVVTSQTNLTADDIRKIERALQRETGSDRINLIGITEGSMILIFDGDSDACNKVQALFQEGRLDEILEIPIENVEVVTPSKPRPLDTLSQWLREQFSTDWQPVTNLVPSFRSVSNRVERSGSISRAKEINLGGDLIDRPFALLLGIEQEQENQFLLRVQIHPTRQASSKDLPLGLQLSVLDEQGEICCQEQVDSPKPALMVAFSSLLGELFTVRIAYRDTTIREDFMI